MTKTKQQDDLAFLYITWFCTYADHPDRDLHFNNAKLCIREDIQAGLLPDKCKALVELRRWFKEFEVRLKQKENNDR